MESQVENYMIKCTRSYKPYDGEDGLRIRRVTAETCTNICVQFYNQKIAKHVSLIQIYRTLCRHVAAISCSHFVGALTCKGYAWSLN
jgi:hypothetical protein